MAREEARASFARTGADWVTNSFQMRAGRSPPVTPLVGLLSSLPTHTPTTMSLVNPMNHASLWFWLVPVFPSAGTLILAPRAVPSRTTLASTSCMAARAAGLLAVWSWVFCRE